MSTSFKMFPVGPDKRPLLTGWQDKATADPKIIADWQKQGAKAFGIPTGESNGLFVIDLDTDKETGEAIGAAKLEQSRYGYLLDQVCVTTPSGGAHIYFQHFEGARNSTSKLAPKVDTRGEGGYVVAPGSVIACGEYKGAYPSSLPVVPLGIRALLLQKHQPQTYSGGREAAAGEVQELLEYIPADCTYSNWVAVLMALHAKFAGSEEGLQVADTWSASGSKYKPGEVASKWRTFKGSGVSWATIPALARQNGADLSEIARRWPA